MARNLLPPGNVQAILIDGDKLDPVSDPRGEGVGAKSGELAQMTLK